MENKFAPSNSQIRDFLSHYISIPNPEYAVFLDGDWGVGKTWLVNRLQADNTAKRFLRVSLFGKKSRQALDYELLEQAYPLLADQRFKLIRGMIGKLGTKIGVNLPFGDSGYEAETNVDLTLPFMSFKHYLSKATDIVLVFDDLERCENRDELLGFINEFVEHYKANVILIGNEAELDSDDFQKENEKLVGRQFSVEPDFDSAFKSFAAQIKDENCRKVILKNTSVIKTIFEKTKQKNLRTLKFGFQEYARFFGQMPERARENSAFQAASIESFFILCIGLRMGNLVESDLANLKELHQTSSFGVRHRSKAGDHQEIPKLVTYYDEHFSGWFQDMEPNAETLHYFFNFGFVPKNTMEDAIDSNQFFLNKSSPSWVKLWNHYGLSGVEFKQLFNEVLEDFLKLKFTLQGEVRHVVGMLLSCAKKGMTELQYSEAQKIVTDTIDEMIQKKTILPVRWNERRPFFDDSFYGLQYSGLDDELFKTTTEKLWKYQADLERESLVASSNSIIALLKDDSEKFFESLAKSEANEMRFYRKPILQFVDVREFADALMLPPKNRSRHDISLTFIERYKHVNSSPELCEELEWLKKLDSLLELSEKTLDAFERFHIAEFRNRALKSAISNIEHYQAAKTLPSQS